MKSSINSIESCGTVDGPGIRCVVFLNQCLLRCKYCHNPEMWNMQGYNYTEQELVNKIKRFKPYFNKNGGVTFSGGEPLLQSEFLVKACKLLHQEGIHIALDTAGYSNSDYKEILENIDLIIYDIKDITQKGYQDLTGGNIFRTWEFLKCANELNKEFWVRLVIVPGIHDNFEYMKNLNKYIKKHINTKNISKIEFLPYHKLGKEKYATLGIKYPYDRKEEIDKGKANKLYEYFMKLYNEE